VRRVPWAPLAVALALRLVPVLLADRAVADVERYRRVATHLLDVSWNPYETRRLYPYPPPWAAVEAGAEWLARHGVGAFPVNVKVPILLADLLIVLTLAASARAGGASAAAAWIYAVHPVSILVTGFHGQFDAVALALVLLSLETLARGRRDGAALLLGAAIATKSFPVLLLPFLALSGGASPRRAARFAALAVAPVAVLLAPFAVADLRAVTRELLSYSGIADFGWTGLVRGVSWLATGVLPRSEARFWPTAALASKVLFLAAWAGLVVLVARRRLALSAPRASLVTVLAFCVFYGSLSAQYLLWPVALGVPRPARPFALYSAAATVALLGFYPFLAPGILWPGPLTGRAALFGRLWVLGTAATLAAAAFWLASALREDVGGGGPASARERARWLG
jgi:hypothetical protein